MFNFDNKFFERNQKRLLFIANNKWLKFLLGLNRLPKEIKGLKIDKITPNSIHHNLESTLTKKGRYKKQKVKAYFFTRPRFAEALAYNLSPFCYFQELRSRKFSWRFSPAGLAYILLFGLLGKFAGLPIAFMGTTTNYVCAAGDGYIRNYTSGTWAAIQSAASGDSTESNAIVADSIHRTATGYFGIFRGYIPVNTSALPDGATISAVDLVVNVVYVYDNDQDAYDWVSVVSATQPGADELALADYSAISDTELIDSGERLDCGTLGVGWSGSFTFSFNATGIAAVSKTGYTNLAVREGHDLTNNTVSSSGNGDTGANISASSGGANDAYLSVTYTVVVAPTVTTQAASSITTTTAIYNGNITNTGGEDCDQRGQAVDTTSHGAPGNVDPSTGDYQWVSWNGGTFGTGAWTGGNTGLEPNTTYYVRMWAHNSAGWGYGDEVSFTTATTYTKTIQAKARVKQPNITKTIQAKARVKQPSIAKTVQAKAKIVTEKVKEIQAKASIKRFDISKTVSVKADIKQPNITKTIQAKARVKQPNISKTIQAKARVKQPSIAKTVQAKADIKQSGILKSILAKSRIKQGGIIKTIQARARIWAFATGYVKMKREDQSFPLVMGTNNDFQELRSQEQKGIKTLKDNRVL